MAPSARDAAARARGRRRRGSPRLVPAGHRAAYARPGLELRARSRGAGAAAAQLRGQPRARAARDRPWGGCAAAGEDPEGEIALDELARTGESPDLLKIDVDGPEAEVLAGAANTLRERRPHVVVETHSPRLERRCGELLLDAGYRPLVVTPRRLLAQNRPGEQNRWLLAYGR